MASSDDRSRKSQTFERETLGESQPGQMGDVSRREFTTALIGALGVAVVPGCAGGEDNDDTASTDEAVNPIARTSGPVTAYVVGTERVGQLTGTKRSSGIKVDTDDTITDWMYRPLLNDTGKWNVHGVDLGANTEHEADGRLYIFFGDAAAPPNYPNYDLVCWTTDTEVQRHGGHQAIGWKYFLPNNYHPATGQPDWRFCDKCHGLFYAGNSAPGGTPGTVCSAGGLHSYNLYSLNFILPNDHQGSPVGQWGWRYCANCRSLFYEGAGSNCPANSSGEGPHVAVGWNFCLPNDQQGGSEQIGQQDWRFCTYCNGLYWNGNATKGVCPGAPGGGFRLNGVVDKKSQQYIPFKVEGSIGFLGRNQTPTGAFSHAGRVYVFIWVDREQEGLRGSYLVSSDTPGGGPDSNSSPAPAPEYRQEQLISPFSLEHTSFSQIAAVKIRDLAQFPGMFPSSAGPGVVVFGHGFNRIATDTRRFIDPQTNEAITDTIHLAWSPLPNIPNNPPKGPLSLKYYTGLSGAAAWSTNADDAMPLVPKRKHTSVSVEWLPDARLWILLYNQALSEEDGGPVNGKIMARLATTPFELASAQDIPVFSPDDAQAWLNYMHKRDGDQMHLYAIPTPKDNNPASGFAYGAYLLKRFTKYNGSTRRLDLYYLMSTSCPYQVHLMHTTLQL